MQKLQKGEGWGTEDEKDSMDLRPPANRGQRRVGRGAQELTVSLDGELITFS